MFGWKTCAKPNIWLITSHEYFKQINKIIQVTRTSQKQDKSQKVRGSCWHLEFSQLFLYCPVCIHDAFLPSSICAYMSLIHVISSTCFILCGLWGSPDAPLFPFPSLPSQSPAAADGCPSLSLILSELSSCWRALCDCWGSYLLHQQLHEQNSCCDLNKYKLHWDSCYL